MKSVTRPLIVLAPILLGALILACESSYNPLATPLTTATAIPAKTLSPSPTVTAPLHTSTATATADPALTKSLLADRLANEAWTFLETFTRDLSPRASATDQETAAAEFLAAELKGLGYDVKLQPFQLRVPSSRVTLPNGPDEMATAVHSHPLALSGIGEAMGTLVNVGKGLPEEVASGFAESLTDGSSSDVIALIERGEVTFEEKVKRVVAAGAAGTIIYNNRPGLFSGALSTQADIPVVAITRETGVDIIVRMSAQDLTATVSARMDILESRNVVGEKPGAASDSPIVILGAHIDTVPDVPGANDNGSGIATLITIAGEVAGKTYPFSLRLVAFGAEELGLFGSRWYVNDLTTEERAAAIVMINLDALAGGTNLSVLGNDEFVSTLADIGKQERIPLATHGTLPAGTSSDHASFEAVGIPTVFLLDEEFSRIHTSDDKLEFINPQSMGNAAALAVGLLDRLALR